MYSWKKSADEIGEHICIRVFIENFVERNLLNWTNAIRSFLLKMFANFDKIFDLIFAKFSFNFRSIKIEIFPFLIKNIVFLQKKYLKESFERILRISRNSELISRKNFNDNFCENEQKFLFSFTFCVVWTEFSLKKLSENFKTLIFIHILIHIKLFLFITHQRETLSYRALCFFIK